MAENAEFMAVGARRAVFDALFLAETTSPASRFAALPGGHVAFKGAETMLLCRDTLSYFL